MYRLKEVKLVVSNENGTQYWIVTYETERWLGNNKEYSTVTYRTNSDAGIKPFVSKEELEQIN